MITIVGAGFTGLALSLALDAEGREHRVFEAAARAGGVVRSSRPGGRVLDHGPQRMRATPEVAALVRRLQLDTEVVHVPQGLPLYVVRDGRLRVAPLDPAGLLRTDLLSARAKLRLLAEPLTGAPRRDETVAGLLSRKFGREAYRCFLGPLFGGLYGSDPSEMYARHALAALFGGRGGSGSLLRVALRSGLGRSGAPSAISFREGMGQLVDAMYAAAEPHVALDSPVVSLERREGSGWVVGLEDGTEQTCSTVVLTVPAGEAGALLEPSAADAARRLHTLRYNDLALVHLEGHTPLRGLGYQVAYGEGLRTRGVTWNASALGRDGIYTAFLGGAPDPGAVALDDDELGAIAADEFGSVTGFEVRPLSVTRTRMPAWDRSWNALEGMELPPGIVLCASYESRPGIPGRVTRVHEVVRALTREAGEPVAS